MEHNWKLAVEFFGRVSYLFLSLWPYEMNGKNRLLFKLKAYAHIVIHATTVAAAAAAASNEHKLQMDIEFNDGNSTDVNCAF